MSRLSKRTLLLSMFVLMFVLLSAGTQLLLLAAPEAESQHADESDLQISQSSAGVTGSVVMPDGSVPPFAATIGLRDGEGQGSQTDIDPASGGFRLALPPGRYDVIVHPGNDGYAGPHLEPVQIPPGEVIDLGAIKLLARNAIIAGEVTDNHGTPVAGMPVTAWQRDRHQLLSTRSDANGHYRLAVTGGTWHVQPAPGPDMPYFYLGGGKTVRIGAGEIVRDVNFEVLLADAIIAGFMVTEDGQRIDDVSGWVKALNVAEPAIQAGAPIRDGAFRIHVTRGEYRVSVELPPDSPYLPLGEVKTSVKSGETATITIPLRKKDAAITGQLVDPRQNRRPVTGVEGAVSAWSGDRWASTRIRPELGTYELPVVAGVWHLDYRIASQEYVKLGGGQNVPVQSGQVVKVDLPVTRRDAAVAGRVLAPDGSPLPGALVVAQGLTGDIHSLRLHTRTNEQGRFHLRLPHGRYRIGAPGGKPGWINPVEQPVTVRPGMVAEGIILRFHEPNAVVSGTLTVLNTEAEGEALVWAWSERGGFNKGHFKVTQSDHGLSVDGGQARGAYRLGVLSGTTWYVGAVFETDDEYWLGRAAVNVTNRVTPLDLELSGPYPKPPPVVITFDASQAQRLELADGTKIFIPARAMPVEGLVTLRVVPIATLPHQHHAHIVKYGYAIFASDESGRPIEEYFNRNVLIRFQYDEDDLAAYDVRLRPAYFSTTTNEWTFPERFVVQPGRNLVTMEIDHFTDFALVEGPALEEVFLPTIMR